ncbi:hypothetical protein JCM3765_006858 [Sporobolomyces pararoseus]
MNSTVSDVPPQAFYSSQHESSIGHSNSLAGFSTNPSQPPQPRPNFHRPASTVGASTATDGNGDRYLQAAEGIKLTQEEKQEGYYDPDLLQSRPRNTTAPPPPPPPPENSQVQSSRPSSPPIPASSLPYASRTREDPVTTKGSKSHRPSSKGEAVGGGGENPRDEKSRYPSRPSKDPRHRTGKGGGGGNHTSTSRRNVPRRKRKQLSWWKQPRTFIALVVLIIVVGIAVGLGVGLTTGKKGSERSPGNPGVTSESQTNEITKAGIQPSVSAASVTTQARPTISITRKNRMFAWEEAERRYQEEKKLNVREEKEVRW